ncbi:MAG: protease self-immunity family protein [bacterium]|nr:protease self-immunity family protein [bacterium]
MSWPRRLLAFPLVRIVLAAAPIVLFLSVASKAASSLHLGAHSLGNAIMPAAMGAVVLLLYVGYVRLIERRRADELGGRGAAAEAARGFVIGAALFSVTIAVLLLLGVATVERGDGWRALVVGLLAALGAAMTEETLLRAIFFRVIEGSLGTWIALALSAALFGLLHAFNPGATAVSSVAIALEAGVLLAAAFVFTRRLWMAIGLHTAWNFTEGGIFGASVSGTTPYGLFRTHFAGAKILSGGAFGPEASIVAVLLCLSAGIALCAAARRRGRVIRPFWRR